MTTHEHVFRRAALTYDDGAPIEGGRRCACGMEVVGDGPLAVNANILRAARAFNQGMTAAMTTTGRCDSREQSADVPMTTHWPTDPDAGAHLGRIGDCAECSRVVLPEPVELTTETGGRNVGE